MALKNNRINAKPQTRHQIRKLEQAELSNALECLKDQRPSVALTIVNEYMMNMLDLQHFAYIEAFDRWDQVLWQIEELAVEHMAPSIK